MFARLWANEGVDHRWGAEAGITRARGLSAAYRARLALSPARAALQLLAARAGRGRLLSKARRLSGSPIPSPARVECLIRLYRGARHLRGVGGPEPGSAHRNAAALLRDSRRFSLPPRKSLLNGSHE